MINVVVSFTRVLFGIALLLGSILVHVWASLVSMKLLDLVDWDLVEVLHDFMMSLNDLGLVLRLRDVLSWCDLLLLMLSWLSWLECELSCQVLLRHLVRVLSLTVQLVVELVADSILTHLTRLHTVLDGCILHGV